MRPRVNSGRSTVVMTVELPFLVALRHEWEIDVEPPAASFRRQQRARRQQCGRCARTPIAANAPPRSRPGDVNAATAG
jgi:hypothetical protein